MSTRRWRPSLVLVLGGALFGTLGLSLLGLVALRYLGPEIGFRNAAALLAAVIALATLALGLLLTRLLLRPVQELEAYAEAQEAGEAAPPPKHYGTRELHRTATRVIAMAEALRDREATVRAFTDHVTHELKTPVSAIRAAAELLEDEVGSNSEAKALVAQVQGAETQIDRQLTALRDAARAREARYIGQCNSDDLVALMGAEVPDLALNLKGDRVVYPISSDGMKIVLGQLLRNAGEHGAQNVTLTASENGSGPALVLCDDGAGISPGNAARIFDPFFTTRREEGGTGMGLAIVRIILQAHGASIALEPSPTGAAFRISFDHRA